MTLRKRVLAVAKPTALAFALTTAALWMYQAKVPYGLAWNRTPSIPLGLYGTLTYDRQVLKRGDLVCFAYQAPSWAESRKYAPEGTRLCKPIAGVPGDELQVDASRVTVRGSDGYELSVELKNVDTKGRPMPLNALVSGAIPRGQYLLLATYLPNSYDSRYLGLIPQERISHRAWPLLTKD